MGQPYHLSLNIDPIGSTIVNPQFPM